MFCVSPPPQHLSFPYILQQYGKMRWRIYIPLAPPSGWNIAEGIAEQRKSHTRSFKEQPISLIYIPFKLHLQLLVGQLGQCEGHASAEGEILDWGWPALVWGLEELLLVRGNNAGLGGRV